VSLIGERLYSSGELRSANAFFFALEFKLPAGYYVWGQGVCSAPRDKLRHIAALGVRQITS